MSETNITLLEEQSDLNKPEWIQFFTTVVSIICALISLGAYYTLPKWRKQNYLYAKLIIIKCAAVSYMLLVILVPEDYLPRESLVIPYFALVTMSVLGTVHIVALGHIHVSLSCDEITDEEAFVASSWYYMTSGTVIVLLIVKSVLRLDLQTAECIAGMLLSALTTGNVMFMSRTFNNIERKCRIAIAFIFFVFFLGIFSDVFLILYGGLLLTGDTHGIIHDFLKVACTGVILLKTILILCSKSAMDWKNCRSSNEEDIEM